MFIIVCVVHSTATSVIFTDVHALALPDARRIYSYRQAGSILREIFSWTLTAPAKPEDCSAQISNLTLDAIHVDELPYAHLRPGNVMTFVADGFEELQKGCAPHYDYPLPQDHLLVFHDVARCWRQIGRAHV